MGSQAELRFGPGPIERDRISTGFAEVTRMTKTERSALVLGAAVQADAYRNKLNPSFGTAGLRIRAPVACAK